MTILDFDYADATQPKQYTYAKYLVDGSEHLYDNQNDPLQMHNLVSDPKMLERLNNMREGMARKMQDLNDEFKPCSWYRDQWMDPDDEYSIIAAAQGKFDGPYSSIKSERGRR